MQPADQRLVSEMAPLPLIVVSTGARSRSASRSSTSLAPARATPPPANSSGYLARRRSSAVRATASSDGGWGGGIGGTGGGGHVGGLFQHVNGDFEGRWARASGLHPRQLLQRHALQVCGARDEAGAGGGGHDAGLILELVKIALVLAEQGQLAGGADDQERDGIGPGSGERRDGIGQAGAGGDEGDAGAAGGAGIAVGHVGGALFVASGKADEGVLVVDGVVDRQVVDARDTEGVADPRAHERINNQLTACPCHPVLSFVLDCRHASPPGPLSTNVGEGVYVGGRASRFVVHRSMDREAGPWRADVDARRRPPDNSAIAPGLAGTYCAGPGFPMGRKTRVTAG